MSDLDSLAQAATQPARPHTAERRGPSGSIAGLLDVLGALLLIAGIVIAVAGLASADVKSWSTSLGPLPVLIQLFGSLVAGGVVGGFGLLLIGVGEIIRILRRSGDR